MEVDALDGRPGVYSARYAGPGASAAQRNEKLLAALQGIPAERRTARFRCVVAYVDQGCVDQPLICEGTCEGRIAEVKLARHMASWKGKRADIIIPERIVSEQSTRVDVVSGATNSSIVIMNAVQTALEKAYE